MSGRLLVEIAQCDWDRGVVRRLPKRDKMLKFKIVMFSSMKMEPL